MGLGAQTTAVHTDAQMQKEEKVGLPLMQEQPLAPGLGWPGSPLTRRRASHEPPRLLPRTPVGALVGETRSGSVFWSGAFGSSMSLGSSPTS